MVAIDALVDALGSAPDQPDVQTLLSQIQGSKPVTDVKPEVKAYPDVIYHNYHSLGLSLQFEATSPGKDASKCSPQELRLVALDVYSGHDDKRWTCFPALPISIKAANIAAEVTIKSESTGKDLVSDLGEPQRKGGGAGDRSGPAAWMEWSLQLNSPGLDKKHEFNLQIELAGAAARGADRWNADRAGTCKWAVITIS